MNDPNKAKQSSMWERSGHQPAEPLGVETQEPKPDRNRVTMVSSLTHEDVNDRPTEVSAAAWRYCSSEEQVYSRRICLGNASSPIDFGWVDPDNVGWIIIENLSKEDQREPLVASSINDERLIALTDGGHGSWLIPAGWPFIGFHSDPQCLELSCAAGEVSARVTVIPR